LSEAIIIGVPAEGSIGTQGGEKPAVSQIIIFYRLGCLGEQAKAKGRNGVWGTDLMKSLVAIVDSCLQRD